MAWTEDWANFGPLYVHRPFLNELRVGLVERFLDVDPNDPSTTGDSQRKTMATEIDKLTVVTKVDVVGEGQRNFYTDFQDLMDEELGIGESPKWLQYWDEGNWENNSNRNLPVIDEAVMLTRIGAVSRLAAPTGLSSSLTIDWMLQQYDMLNELRWLRQGLGVNKSNPLANLRRGDDQNSNFATADSNADAEYGAGTNTFDNQNGWPEQYAMAQRFASNILVRYETKLNNLDTTIYDAYKSDVDVYLYGLQDSITNIDGFDQFDTTLVQNELTLQDTSAGVGGSGGFGTDDHFITFPANTDFTTRSSPGEPAAPVGSRTGIGWTLFESGSDKQGSAVVVKFDVTDGFTKVD